MRSRGTVRPPRQAAPAHLPPAVHYSDRPHLRLDFRQLPFICRECFIRFDWSLCPTSCYATYASVGSMRATCLLLLCTLGLYAQPSKFGGDSDAHPPVSKADVRIVQEARKILNSPAQWNRADNRECPATEKTYSIYCALEKATEEVSRNFQHRGAAMQEARFVIDEVLATGNHYEHRLKDYNNDPKTTFSDVRKFFDLLEARIESRLAAESKP